MGRSPSALRRQRTRPNRARRDVLYALILFRDGDGCWICGGPLAWDERGVVPTHPLAPSLDHVEPFCESQSWDVEVLKLAHVACNEARECG